MIICSHLGLTYTQPPRAPECLHFPAHPKSQPAAVQVFPAKNWCKHEQNMQYPAKTCDIHKLWEQNMKYFLPFLELIGCFLPPGRWSRVQDQRRCHFGLLSPFRTAEAGEFMGGTLLQLYWSINLGQVGLQLWESKPGRQRQGKVGHDTGLHVLAKSSQTWAGIFLVFF